MRSLQKESTVSIFSNNRWVIRQGDYIDGFKAGSYGSYGQFRRELCEKVLKCTINHVWNNPYYYKGKPFYYLINFADNEGTISGKAFDKLKKDFENHDLTFDSDWMNEKYKLWKDSVLQAEAVTLH